MPWDFAHWILTLSETGIWKEIPIFADEHRFITILCFVIITFSVLYTFCSYGIELFHKLHKLFVQLPSLSRGQTATALAITLFALSIVVAISINITNRLSETTKPTCSITMKSGAALVSLREPVVLTWTYSGKGHQPDLYEIEGADKKDDFKNSKPFTHDGTSWPVREKTTESWWRVRAKVDEVWTSWSDPVKTIYYENVYDRIKHTGVLAVVVSSDISQGIFKFPNDGKRAGVDIELVNHIAKQLATEMKRDIKISISSITWDKLFDTLGNGTADFVIAAVTKLKTRESKFKIKFSETYFCTGKSLLYNMNSVKSVKSSVRSLINGKAVGYGTGTASEVLIEKLSKEMADNSFTKMGFGQVEEPIAKLLTPYSDIQFAVTDTAFAVARVLEEKPGILASRPFLPSDFPSTSYT